MRARGATLTARSRAEPRRVKQSSRSPISRVFHRYSHHVAPPHAVTDRIHQPRRRHRATVCRASHAVSQRPPRLTSRNTPEKGTHEDDFARIGKWLTEPHLGGELDDGREQVGKAGR